MFNIIIVNGNYVEVVKFYEYENEIWLNSNLVLTDFFIFLSEIDIFPHIRRSMVIVNS